MPSPEPTPAAEPLAVWYELTLGPGEDPGDKALGVAIEQTVEMAPDLIPPDLLARALGRVEELRQVAGVWRARIAYPAAAAGPDLAQLLNLLFGNVSMKAGIRVAAVDWPAALLARHPGPRFGIEGVRAACGVSARRPLLCTAVKPQGASVRELAATCVRLARGVDLVKDDHGLADQPTAPFRERVARCQEAVARAGAETGRTALYVPNLTGPAHELPDRLAFLAGIGCRAAMVSPLLAGLDSLRWLREAGNLVLLAHPALSGALFVPGHGIAPEVLLGQVFRLAGADGVIFPYPGGRFVFSAETCDAIVRGLRGPLGDLRAAFPVPGGGFDLESLPRCAERYGPDTILLVGSSLYRQPDPGAAGRRLIATFEELFA